MPDALPDDPVPVDLSDAFAPSASGKNFGYQVQARYVGSEGVKQIGNHLFGQKWRNIPVALNVPGVPTTRRWDWWMPATDCMTYEAAQAIRWWFLADSAANETAGRLCIETRIVKFEINYSVSGKACAVMEEDKDAWRKGFA